MKNCEINKRTYRIVAEELAQKDGKKRFVVETENCFDIVTYEKTRFKVIYTTENGK